MPTDLPEPQVMIAYAHRPKPFSTELEMELTARELVATRGRSIQRFPLNGIERIRLTFAPRNTAHLAFACHVRARDGKSVRFDSLSWKSLIETERQNVDYVRFVRTLCARVEAASKDVTFEAGVSPFKHASMLVVGIGLIVALLATTVYAVSNGSWSTGMLAFALLAYLGWWLYDYLRRNRPKSFRADAIPALVLPDDKAG